MKKQKRKTFPPSFIAACLVCMGGISIALLYHILKSQNFTNDDSVEGSPVSRSTLNELIAAAPACSAFFLQSFGSVLSSSVETGLIGTLHQTYDDKVVDCLTAVSAPGDRLLIESPDSGKEVPCGSVDPVYAKFEGKLRCFGVDVPIDEARRRFQHFVFRFDFITRHMPRFFQGGKSGDEIISGIKSFADILLSETKNKITAEDPNFHKRNAKYLKQLARKMQGLDREGIIDFLDKELKLTANKREQYELLSRRGPTNRALVDHLRHHQSQLANSPHRLFAVSGARHTDPRLNEGLANLLAEGANPISLLTPKPYALPSPGTK